MALYKIGDKLASIRESSFKLEKEIQKLTEENLSLIFKLQLVRSEFSLNNFRIDTLAFDKEVNAFVIIEYKRDKNFSVIDQGYAYLSLMLNNKADFILEYNEQQPDFLKRNNVDWSQSRVIFISPSFTFYQREAINFKDLPIELWEVKKYENNTVSFEQVQKTNAQESIKTISRSNENVEKVSTELKVYTEQEHILNAEFEIRELYENFKERVLNFADNVTLNPRKQFVGYKIEGNTFCDIVFQKKALLVLLNLKSRQLDDPRKIAEDVSNKGHWGNGAYRIRLDDSENLEYILSLVKQSMNKNKI